MWYRAGVSSHGIEKSYVTNPDIGIKKQTERDAENEGTPFYTSLYSLSLVRVFYLLCPSFSKSATVI